MDMYRFATIPSGLSHWWSILNLINYTEHCKNPNGTKYPLPASPQVSITLIALTEKRGSRAMIWIVNPVVDVILMMSSTVDINSGNDDPTLALHFGTDHTTSNNKFQQCTMAQKVSV